MTDPMYIEDEDAIYSREAEICMTCWGEGSGEECEMMLDWVNYGRAWALCPDCKGTGLA